MNRSDSKRKQGKNHANSLVSDPKNPSHQPTTSSSRKTTSKKRMLEEDLQADAPAKRAKTDGSKKIGRLAKPNKTHGRKHVDRQESTASNLSHDKRDKKRKHLDEQESTAKTSGDIKRVKIESAENAAQKYVLFTDMLHL